MNEIGRKIIRLAEVDSTNEYAKHLIGMGAEEGLAIVSETQTKGKGRLDRLWESPKGGLWLSIILEPEEPISGDKLGILPLMAGCAAAGAIQCTGLNARVKWPNDVIIHGKKACGILSESITHDGRRYVIIGIGINVNNKVREGYEFSDVSTSIIEEIGQSMDIELVERALLSEMNRLYRSMKEDSRLVLEEWKKMADTIGRRVVIITPSGDVTGTAKDIDENGALLMEVEDGIIATVTVGDCRHLD